MKIATKTTLLFGLACGLVALPQFTAAQTCKDEQSMSSESKKDLTQLIGTVKQESLPDYEKAYHQKTVVNKLTFYGVAVQELVTCLEKASQDPAASKDAAAATKAQYDDYSKLKDKIQHDLDTLKTLAAPKDSKEFAGKLGEST